MLIAPGVNCSHRSLHIDILIEEGASNRMKSSQTNGPIQVRAITMKFSKCFQTDDPSYTGEYRC